MSMELYVILPGRSGPAGEARRKALKELDVPGQFFRRSAGRPLVL
jgi:hypothetical protein